MDTSKTYIKMSDCPEIQEQNPEFDYFRDFKYSATQGIAIVRGNWFSTDGTWQDAIWLPRQDQLQEMASQDIETLLDKFNIWEAGCGFIRERDNFFSMEQLWLAFVMNEKYNKIWEEETWKKKKESQGD